MNMMEANTLRKLDETVFAGKAAAIGTQFGEIEVHPTRFHGFCAEILDLNNRKHISFGETPTIAFLKLADFVRAMNN